ncbi:MAG: glycosyltransferase family 9 protein [Deltaproteobacteria bacterium]|jgi:heptosyltransferase-3|nr:glycosyltransferase family 9 protein [Deltaproteobacteria bacterium]
MSAKALIISLKHLGDTVVSTVLIPMLKRRFPGMEIHYLVNPDSAPLVESHPEVAKVYPAPRKTGAARLLNFVRSLRRERYSHSFDLSENDRAAMFNFLAGAGTKAALFTRKGYVLRNLAARIKAPSWKYNPELAAAECIADLARAVGCREKTAPLTSLGLSPVGKREAAEFLALHNPAALPYAVCHFAAMDPFRLWPAGHCAEAVRFLQERLGPVFLATSGADSEMGLLERVIALSGGKAVTTRGLGMRGFMALAAGARGVLGLDSFVGHLAGAYGVPVVTIFGPSREKAWLPKGPWVRAAHMDLPCRSCVTGGCLPGNVSRCLKEMDFSTWVKPHLEDLLAAPFPLKAGLHGAAA